MDTIFAGDTGAKKLGKTTVLPSLHCGSPWYRVQNYQDAMAICKWVGYPNFFIIFTANPKWPEIQYMISPLHDVTDDNRADIICIVFEIK